MIISMQKIALAGAVLTVSACASQRQVDVPTRLDESPLVAFTAQDAPAAVMSEGTIQQHAAPASEMSANDLYWMEWDALEKEQQATHSVSARSTISLL